MSVELTVAQVDAKSVLSVVCLLMVRVATGPCNNMKAYAFCIGCFSPQTGGNVSITPCFVTWQRMHTSELLQIV